MLGNFSYCLQFAGFIATEALMMRGLLMGGSMSFVLYALVQPKKLWIPAIWESTFASIHAYKIYEIMKGDRIDLSPDEMRLYALLFGHHQLDPHAFKRLVDLGKWGTHEPGEVLTAEGKHVSKVRLLVSGGASVIINGETVCQLNTPGNFIGEMALMQNFIHLHDEDEATAKTDWAIASATVKSANDLVCFEWNTDELLEYLDKDEDSGVLVKTFFEDVMVKLRNQRNDASLSMARWKNASDSATPQQPVTS